MDHRDRLSRQGISGHVRKIQSMYCLSLNSSGSDAHRLCLRGRELCMLIRTEVQQRDRHQETYQQSWHFKHILKQTQLQTIVRVLPVPSMQLPRLRIIDIKVASQSNIPLITLELRRPDLCWVRQYSKFHCSALSDMDTTFLVTSPSRAQV